MNLSPWAALSLRCDDCRFVTIFLLFVFVFRVEPICKDRPTRCDCKSRIVLSLLEATPCRNWQRLWWVMPLIACRSRSDDVPSCDPLPSLVPALAVCVERGAYISVLDSSILISGCARLQFSPPTIIFSAFRRAQGDWNEQRKTDGRYCACVIMRTLVRDPSKDTHVYSVVCMFEGSSLWREIFFWIFGPFR